MQNEESNVIFQIIFVALFCGVLLLGVVLIIEGLNSGNSQAGQTLSGSVSGELLEGMIGQTRELSANNVSNPTCTITSVTDLAGNLIASGNYSVNNCEITYNP